MENYSALKRNELLSPEKTWTNLEYIIAKERSQCEKATYYVIPSMYVLKKTGEKSLAAMRS